MEILDFQKITKTRVKLVKKTEDVTNITKSRHVRGVITIGPSFAQPFY